MDLFIQQLVDGVAWGSLYGAVALAIVLVYRASGLVNFAQGEMAMLSTFIVWTLYTLGVPIWIAIVIGVALAFVGGGLTERILIRPFADNPSHLPIIVVTLGLMLAINSAAGWIWGYLPKQLPAVFGEGRVPVLGAWLSLQLLGVVVTVAVIALLLWILYQRTRLGLYLRAASDNPESARLSGVPVDRMLMLGWGLAAAIGAVAGVLAAPLVYVQPNMMATLLLYAFAAATLGGFDSPPGALVGGVIVGVAENLAGTYIAWIGADFKQAVALIIIMLVLLIRPEGLFGARKVARV